MTNIFKRFATLILTILIFHSCKSTTTTSRKAASALPDFSTPNQENHNGVEALNIPNTSENSDHSIGSELGLDGVNQDCLNQTDLDTSTLNQLTEIEKEIVIATNKFRSAPSQPPGLLNFRRASVQPTIAWDHCLSLIARNWSRTLSTNSFRHNNCWKCSDSSSWFKAASD